ncbi:MAG TPA: hypothetical protein ENK18_18490 [Deltaproteobacteria bacterium]|nr:hypothetical protein [Deltaproteobacteria bacterium]
MKLERAVVLSEGPPGLRVAAWLARRGVAVRHLGLGPTPVDPAWPSVVVGHRSVLQPWTGRLIDVAGPRRPLHRGELVEIPGRRRDLAAAAGGSLIGLTRDLRPRRRRPTTLGEWGVRQHGVSAWEGLLRPLLTKQLGTGCDPLPVSLAGLLIAPAGARGWAPGTDAREAAEAQREAVLSAGGESLCSVQVEGIEVEDGRVAAVMTEFGRERVDGGLYTDLPPSHIASLLPKDALTAGARAALAALPVEARTVVELRVEAAGLPWEIWVTDPQSPAIRLQRASGRPGEPRPDRLFVTVGGPEAEAEGVAQRLVSPLAEVKGVLGTTRHTVPVALRSTEGLDALKRLGALGIVGVGARALHLPLSLSHEARLAAAWAAARAPGQALEELLVPPPSVRGRELLP